MSPNHVLAFSPPAHDDTACGRVRISVCGTRGIWPSVIVYTLDNCIALKRTATGISVRIISDEMWIGPNLILGPRNIYLECKHCQTKFKILHFILYIIK